jgi:hypothetical protein
MCPTRAPLMLGNSWHTTEELPLSGIGSSCAPTEKIAKQGPAVEDGGVEE